MPPVASILLRAVALAAMLAGVVGAWRSGRLSGGERRALLVITVVVVATVAGVLLWASAAGGE